MISVIRGLTSQLPVERSGVLVRRDTWTDVYPSPEVIRYEAAGDRATRKVALSEAAFALLGRKRHRSQAEYGGLVSCLIDLEPATVIAHNLPLLTPLIPAKHVSVLYAHNYLWRTYGRPELARAFGNLDAVIGVSEWLSERLRSRLPRRLREHVHTVINGVDTDVFSPASETTTHEPIHIVFIGRVIEHKGIDVLIKALTKLSHLAFRATVVGSSGFSAETPMTAYEGSLRKLGAELASAGKLTFQPFVSRDRVPALLCGADIYVAPSRFEDPCPLGVLEAMACGLAVVGSRVGGIPELIGRVDMLVPKDDPDRLALVIESLIRDESLLHEAKNDMRQRAINFSWRNAAERLARVVDGEL